MCAPKHTLPLLLSVPISAAHSSTTHLTPMDQEHETLDWGNDEDEQLNPYPGSNIPETDDNGRKTNEVDDVEDAVSLDGNDEDMQDLYRQNAQAIEAHDDVSTPKPKTRSLAQASAEPSYSDLTAQFSGATLHAQSRASQAEKVSTAQPSNRERTVSVTHPLPAKPQVAAPIPRTQDHIYSATTMRLSSDTNRLPSGWVTKQSTKGNGMYYYNTKTHETTWDRPVEERKDVFRSKEVSRSNARQDDMTYNDRHYRPESASQSQDLYRKESRQTYPSKQVPAASEDSPVVYDREASTSAAPQDYRNGYNGTKRSPRGDVSSRPASGFSSTIDNRSRNDRDVPERDQMGAYDWTARQPPPLQEVAQSQYAPESRTPYRYSPPESRTSHRNNETRQASPHSTLSDHPSPPPPRRRCSSRGGGLVFTCLEKPWGTSCASTSLYFRLGLDRHKDAHHGFLYIYSPMLAILQDADLLNVISTRHYTCLQSPISSLV
jgi:hypothetical protein